MAANIDKGLYAAPLGIEESAAEELPLEIEIEDPESVTIGIDGHPILTIEPGAFGRRWGFGGVNGYRWRTRHYWHHRDYFVNRYC